MALPDGDDAPSDDAIAGPDLDDEDYEQIDVGDAGVGGAGRGISLADLGRSFAQLLGRGRTGQPPAEGPACQQPADEPDNSPLDDEDEDFVVSPNSILEAMLFVGHPNNEPLTSRQLASLIRGVSPQEVDQLVADLNNQYTAAGQPYEIVTEGDGYRMVLREQLAYLRERFYGRMREARLSQPAIDVLAVVAYHQPATRQEVDKICQRPTGSVLSQLVRRRLLRIEQTDKPRKKLYYTTDRFLHFFHIESLADLPRPQDTADE